MSISNDFALGYFVFGEAVKYWKRKKIQFSMRRTGIF